MADSPGIYRPEIAVRGGASTRQRRPGDKKGTSYTPVNMDETN
jgi:hypothetical protein